MSIKEGELWRQAYKYADKVAEGDDNVTSDTFQAIQVLLMQAFVRGFNYAQNCAENPDHEG